MVVSRTLTSACTPSYLSTKLPQLFTRHHHKDWAPQNMARESSSLRSTLSRYEFDISKNGAVPPRIPLNFPQQPSTATGSPCLRSASFCHVEPRVGSPSPRHTSPSDSPEKDQVIMAMNLCPATYVTDKDNANWDQIGKYDRICHSTQRLRENACSDAAPPPLEPMRLQIGTFPLTTRSTHNHVQNFASRSVWTIPVLISIFRLC